MRVAIQEAAEAVVFRQGFEACQPEERFTYLLEGIFEEIKETYADQKIALVCGIVSGNGDEHISANILKLIEWRNKIRKTLSNQNINLPTLTSPFVFTELVYERVGAFELDRRERELLFQKFYREFLKSGRVSYIFVTPGFENSEGTLDEIQTANEERVAVMYVNETRPIGDLEVA